MVGIKLILLKLSMLLAVLFFAATFSSQIVLAQAQTQSGAIGLEGKIPSAAPAKAPTITVPSNGQAFSQLPITVSGTCQTDLLVKVFKNNVFGGSAVCKNGSYSITIDLFSGKNELVAKQYDDLDQASPDSNKVTVTFNDANFTTFGTHVSLSSQYAKRGVNPGDTLTWPIILSGGQGPYAVSINWGDGSDTQLMSQQNPGTFTISHKYDSPGFYNILIKATDKNGGTAYLQLVGVANGKVVQQASSSSKSNIITIIKVLWWPAVVAIPLIILTFWLGRRHELYVLRKQIERQNRK